MVVREGSDAMPVNQTTLELEGDREIVISRSFNGPARILFDAWTKPELVMRWWAPKSLGVSMISVDADVRAGGRYRYVFRHRTGAALAFSGRYIEVTSPSRLVYTQIFEPTAGEVNPGDAEVVITVTFEEGEGKTHLVSRSLCPTREIRDAIIATGMETGMRETMDQLDELVGSLR